MTQPAPQAPGPPPGDHDARPELAALVDTLRASGQPATLTAEGRHGWVPNARGELLRVPLECTDLPARGDLREVLAQPGTYLCSYMRFPAAEAPRNCFDYVCRDRDYSVEQLSKNGRRDVRRGLRCFEVRTCTVEEMSAQGFGAYADTEVRHDHTPPPREEFDLRRMPRSAPMNSQS